MGDDGRVNVAVQRNTDDRPQRRRHAELRERRVEVRPGDQLAGGVRARLTRDLDHRHREAPRRRPASVNVFTAACVSKAIFGLFAGGGEILR